MNKIIEVEYKLYTSTYSIRNKIPELLANNSIISFDCETRSVYNKSDRDDAKEYLKQVTTADPLYSQARMVAESSGLSYPSLVRTTHFLFGESKNKSHIVVCYTRELEVYLWNLIADYKGKLLVHNALYDLKIMYQRTGKLPIDYVDTALMVKCLINHTEIWKAKVGLKGLMGEYYDPRWSLMNDYEPVNLKDNEFIRYCSIDAASTYYLHELVLKEFEKTK